MPDYKITVFFKSTNTFQQGIRSHPSNNPDEVRKIISEMVHIFYDDGVVDWVDVMPTALGKGKEVKPLVGMMISKKAEK